MFRKSWTSPISIYRLQGNWDQYDEGHLCGKLTIRRDRSKRRQQERRKYDMAAILFWWFVSQYLNISISQSLNISIFQSFNISISQYINFSKGGRRRGEGLTRLPSCPDASFLNIGDCNWNYFLSLESDLSPNLCLNWIWIMSYFAFLILKDWQQQKVAYSWAVCKNCTQLPIVKELISHYYCRLY